MERLGFVVAIILLLVGCGPREPSEVEIKTEQFKKDAHCKVISFHDQAGELTSCGKMGACKQVNRIFIYKCDGDQSIEESLYINTIYIR